MPVTKSFVSYIKKQPLIFEVFGHYQQHPLHRIATQDGSVAAAVTIPPSSQQQQQPQSSSTTSSAFSSGNSTGSGGGGVPAPPFVPEQVGKLTDVCSLGIFFDISRTFFNLHQVDL